jgi:hypothetical protein
MAPVTLARIIRVKRSDLLGVKLSYRFGNRGCIHNKSLYSGGKQKVDCPHAHSPAQHCVGTLFLYCVYRHTGAMRMVVVCVHGCGDLFAFGIIQCEKRRTAEMVAHGGFEAILIE